MTDLMWKRALPVVALVVLVAGCYVPNNRTADGRVVRWGCGPLGVAVFGPPGFTPMVWAVLGEIDSMTGRHFADYGANPAAPIVVKWDWTPGAPVRGGFTGQTFNADALYVQSVVWVNPAVSAINGWRTYGTIRHELGHALGIGHNPDPQSIMYGANAVEVWGPHDGAQLREALHAAGGC